MNDDPTTSWRTRSRAAAFASHRLIGWIYWDPVAIEGYRALGCEPLSYYIASRAGRLLDAGPDVVTAAYYSIRPEFVAYSVEECRRHTDAETVATVRDDAVRAGLGTDGPDVCDDLAALGPALWDAVDTLPVAGRVLFAAHRGRRRADDPLVSAWLAVNCIREWRGDTHWAIHAADDIGPVEAGLLDAAWRGHDDDWLPRSRGADDDDIAAALARLSHRGLADGTRVNAAGVAHRQQLEDRLDDLASLAWRSAGADTTDRFVGLLDRLGDALMARIDATAGPRWMPAGRDREASST